MNRRLFCIFFAAVIMVGLSKCDECFAQVGKYVLRQVPKALPKMIPKNGQVGVKDQMKGEGDRKWSPAGNFLKSVGLLGAGAVGGALLAGMGNEAQAAANVTPDVAGTAGAAGAGNIPAGAEGGQWVQVDSYDFNGDGIADAELIDLDGDGVADIQKFDLDGDGLADVVEIDTDGDGVVDTVFNFFGGLFG